MSLSSYAKMIKRAKDYIFCTDWSKHKKKSVFGQILSMSEEDLAIWCKRISNRTKAQSYDMLRAFLERLIHGGSHLISRQCLNFIIDINNKFS